MALLSKVLKILLILLLLALAALAVAMSYTSECGPVPAAGNDTTSMTAALTRCYGSPAVLSVESVDRPAVAADQILVKIQAAAVNPLDWHYMRGSPYLIRLMSGLGKPDDPRTGVDFAGTVEAVGEDVTLFEPGDEVFGGAKGAFAEYLVIGQERSVAVKPANISFEQAAAIPIAAVTALQALRDAGQVSEGDKVLINGASGGVGTYAVQIAKSMGAEVTGVCSTRNVEMVRSIGADHVVDYKQSSVLDSEQRFDVIIDNVGNYSLREFSRIMAPDGLLVMVGGPSGDWIGPFAGSLSAMLSAPFLEQDYSGLLARLNKEDLLVLADLARQDKVRSVIDKRYRLEDIAQALTHSESGRARGKIILSME